MEAVISAVINKARDLSESLLHGVTLHPVAWDGTFAPDRKFERTLGKAEIKVKGLNLSIKRKSILKNT